MTSIKILFWNAGGFNYDKFTKLIFIAFNQNFDLLGIVESGASTEHFGLLSHKWISDFLFAACTTGCFMVSLLYIRDPFTENMTVRHTMTDSDRLEAVEINAWRGDLHYCVFFLYDPPNNQPNLDCLLDGWSRRSLLFGDFHAHSQRWRYSNTDTVGSLVENFIDSAPIEYIENKDSDPNFCLLVVQHLIRISCWPILIY
ncbi:hypothetical protein TNCT_143491 [Trichonephila clavata]|uniref:Endonuclease/exonuclease/phosphatase domain-containing protein n=1 Tax=Trichonephila clavata TaxID=2740835 RepID=A0A8X6I549_TRICU|nr:hypothetical protein TNCT_143491 [Trichonephila clavata]